MKNLILKLSILTILIFTKFTSAQISDIKFEYRYEVHVETTDQPNTDLTFLLDKEEKFTALDMNQNGMNVLVLFDTDKKTSYSMMSFDGQKIAVETQMKPQKFLNNAEDFSDAKITDLPDKKIAGFNGKGIKIKTSSKTYKVYYTSDADYHFYDVFKMNATETLYSKIQEKLKIPKESIMLESTTIDNASNEVESKMTCTTFNKINRTVKGSEYKIQSAIIQN